MNEVPAVMEHYTWDEMEKEPLSEKASRQYVTGKKAMMARIFFKKGALVPTHQHESEQITYILEGALLFRLEGKEVTVSKGQVLLIPSNVPHSAEALEDTLDLDVFSPIRQDWIDKDDAYLRR
ncbi:MAG: cupin domain-containing protein [Bryobacteraceae bacterium]